MAKQETNNETTFSKGEGATNPNEPSQRCGKTRKKKLQFSAVFSSTVLKSNVRKKREGSSESQLRRRSYKETLGSSVCTTRIRTREPTHDTEATIKF